VLPILAPEKRRKDGASGRSYSGFEGVLKMPISYAFLLGVPIGLFFYWVARFCLHYTTNSFGKVEHRASLAFGAFGVLLVPFLWTFGCLHDAFPNFPGVALGFLLLLVESFFLMALFRPLPWRGMNESEPKDHVEP
jgi:hypothetical protein